MPPTFLLVAAVLGVALLAPVVVAVTVLALAVPRCRRLALSMLQAGALGAALCVSLDGVLYLALGLMPTVDLLVAAGFGFVAGAVGWPVWKWARTPLPELRPPDP
jgi:hypothetical protein